MEKINETNERLADIRELPDLASFEELQEKLEDEQEKGATKKSITRLNIEINCDGYDREILENPVIQDQMIFLIIMLKNYPRFQMM